MESSIQVSIAPPRRDHTPSHNSSHTGSENISQPLKLAPQFINVVNPLSKDRSSQRQVRAQVMKDYHRRRIEKESDRNAIEPRSISIHSTSISKGQTQKFRLRGENGLRPWVPAKSVKKAAKKINSKGSRVDSHKTPKGTTNGQQEQMKEDYVFSSNVRHDQVDDLQGLVELDWISTEPAFDNFARDIEVTNQWLSTVDEPLRKSVFYHSPSAGSIEPFGAMALLITSRTKILLHYYFNERLKSSWLMMPMRKGLFSLAVHDAAMFHTFLTHYIASYNARFQIADTNESLHHRTMAIKIVNDRLSDPTHLPSDGTIAAVANLAAYECSNGSAESALVHWNGLEQMVNMRGGLYGGDFAPHIQRLLGWTDFHCANALLQRPRFPSLTVPIAAEPIYPPPTHPTSPSWTSSFYSTSLPAPIRTADTIDSLLTGIQSLSSTLQSLRRRAIMPQEDIWYSDRLYHLQRQLAEIVYTPSDTSTYIDSARAIAALMYCGHCLRDVPFSFSSMVKAVTRLKTALGIAEARSYDYANDDDDDNAIYAENQSEKIFWTVTLGGIASEGKAERAWYVAKFRRCCDELGMIDWPDVRELLSKSAWQDELDDAGMRLWTAAI